MLHGTVTQLLHGLPKKGTVRFTGRGNCVTVHIREVRRFEPSRAHLKTGFLTFSESQPILNLFFWNHRELKEAPDDSCFNPQFRLR